MSRRHEPTVTRTTEQKDLSSQGPHNEHAHGARHEDVASAAAPGSAMNKAGKTPLVPRTDQSKVRKWSSRGAH